MKPAMKPRVFAVTFTTEDDANIGEAKYAEVVAAAFPGTRHCRLTATTYLIRSTGLSADVANAVGIKGDERRWTGVVLSVGPHYSGFTSNTVWDWLDDARPDGTATEP